MKSKILLLIALIILIVLSACNTKNSNDTNMHAFEHEVQVKNLGDLLEYNNLVEKYKTIKLETNPRCLIGEITQSTIYDDKIFILSKAIHCFDLEGKYLYSIDSFGRGPGEFLSIINFNVSKNVLYLFDNEQQKLLCYNSDNGDLIDEIKLAYSTISAFVLDETVYYDNIYTKSGTTDFRINTAKIKNTNKLIEGYFNESRYVDRNICKFNVYNDKAYFENGYIGEVLRADAQGKFENYFKINAGKNAIPANKLIELIDTKQYKINEMRNTDFFHNFSNFQASTSHFYGKFFIGKEHYNFVADANSNNIITFKRLERTYNQPLLTEFDGSYEEYLYKIVPTSSFDFVFDMEDSYKDIKFDENSSDYQSKLLIDNLTKDDMEDNPIVFLVKFKSF